MKIFNVYLLSNQELEQFQPLWLLQFIDKWTHSKKNVLLQVLA